MNMIFNKMNYEGDQPRFQTLFRAWGRGWKGWKVTGDKQQAWVNSHDYQYMAMYFSH